MRHAWLVRSAALAAVIVGRAATAQPNPRPDEIAVLITTRERRAK